MKSCLDNGVRIVTEKVEGVRSVSLGIAFLTGSRYENEDNSGISHLVEHMLFKGTKKRDAFRIAVESDSLGAELNGFTSKELTYYYARFLDQHLEKIWDILSDIILNPLFNKEDLEKEKGVVIEEIRNSNDSPEEEVFRQLSESLFPRHPIAYSISGKEEVVKRLTREDLFDFKKKRYCGENAIVAASGKLSFDRLKRLVGDSLLALPHLKEDTPSPPFPQKIIKSKEKRKKDISQVHIAVGRRAFQYDSPYRYPALVLNTLLGGSMSSRLFQRLREKEGLVYTVFSFFQLYSDIGAMGVYLATSPSAKKKAIDIVFEELKKLTKDGLTKEELVNTKEHIKGGLILELESTVARMVRILKEEIYLQREVSIDETLEAVDNVSEDDVVSLARELFDIDKFAISVVEPD